LEQIVATQIANEKHTQRLLSGIIISFVPELYITQGPLVAYSKGTDLKVNTSTVEKHFLFYNTLKSIMNTNCGSTSAVRQTGLFVGRQMGTELEWKQLMSIYCLVLLHLNNFTCSA